jgi:FkbH-like protein
VDSAACKKRWREYLKSRPDAKADVRIGVTSSFTVDPLIPFLGAQLLEHGYFAPRIEIADYNQIAQSCLSPAAAFGGEIPEAIIVAWRMEDVAGSSDAAALRDSSALILKAIESLHASSAGMIIVATPPRPLLPTSGLVRFAALEPEVAIWHETASRIIERLAGCERIHFIDLEALRAGLGAAAHDARKQFLYRQPFSEAYYAAFGAAAARIIRARRYEAKKCLVLDCDNTLWGGVIGEDGVGGIQLGEDFPGSAFKRFQEQVKSLARSGVFVALNSKNNPDDVWEVFEKHDGMVLSRDDIATAQINWRPKSENIKEIAKSLNIGVNSLVFIDDNPFELSEVEANAPGITGLLVPDELSELPNLLRSAAPLFDRLVITGDDLERVSRIQGEFKRQSLSQELTTDDFLAELGLKVFVYEPEAIDLARVTQLINKTNQFNTQTRRLAREEVDAFLRDNRNRLYCMTVADKFGEYGLVGVAMLEPAGEGEYQFSNLLMSCRVLGRGVETTLLAHIAEEVARTGARCLKGSYRPTSKNAMVADIFARHGFEQTAGGEDGETHWRLALPSDLAPPAFVERITARPR